MIRQAHDVGRTAVDLAVGDAIGDENARLDRAARGDDRRPAAVRQAALGGEPGADLAEHLGLQLREVRDGPRHPAGGVVLGRAGRW